MQEENDKETQRPGEPENQRTRDLANIKTLKLKAQTFQSQSQPTGKISSSGQSERKSFAAKTHFLGIERTLASSVKPTLRLKQKSPKVQKP